MSVNLGFAQASSDFLTAALLIYSLAVLAFAGDYAFGRPRRKAAVKAAAPAAAQLATVGAGSARGSQRIACTPSVACARSGSRESTVTSEPCARSSATSRAPSRPVAPVTVTRIMCALSLARAPAGRLMPRRRTRRAGACLSGGPSGSAARAFPA